MARSCTPVIHLDADAFFVSVEQAADAKLRGRPVAVGGLRRGVICSASYEARRWGVDAPMPTARARKLCPRLIVLPGDFAKYELFSRLMFSLAADFTPLVEVRSIDEAYLDVGGRGEAAWEIAGRLQRVVKQTLRLTISEGVAANKLVAQIAAKRHKPAALQQVPAGTEAEFLAPLPTQWLPGVGPALARTLAGAGVREIGQLARMAPAQLALFAGSQARALVEYARGQDDRPVQPEAAPAQSYSQQETFATDVTDEEFLLATLRQMADRLFAKARADEVCLRTVAVRLCYTDFVECRRSYSLPEPTDLETEVYNLLRLLLRQAWERRVAIRRIGLQLSQPYPASSLGQLALGPIVGAASDPEKSLRDPLKQQRAARAMDQLRYSYGPKAILRGHDLWLQKQAAQPREIWPAES
jgi:DNA polymerase-4